MGSSSERFVIKTPAIRVDRKICVEITRVTEINHLETPRSPAPRKHLQRPQRHRFVVASPSTPSGAQLEGQPICTTAAAAEGRNSRRRRRRWRRVGIRCFDFIYCTSRSVTEKRVRAPPSPAPLDLFLSSPPFLTTTINHLPTGPLPFHPASGALPTRTQ